MELEEFTIGFRNKLLCSSMPLSCVKIAAKFSKKALVENLCSDTEICLQYITTAIRLTSKYTYF